MKNILCVFGMVMAAPALAEEPPLCGTSSAGNWEKIQEVFTGDWLVKHRAGYVLMGLWATWSCLSAGMARSKLSPSRPAVSGHAASRDLT